MKEAWASSVFSINTWWHSFSYGADAPLRGSLWMSTHIGSKEEVVTWEAFLEKYSLLEAVTIFWRYAPG